MLGVRNTEKSCGSLFLSKILFLPFLHQFLLGLNCDFFSTATEMNNLEVVRMLLDGGGDPNIISYKNVTALHVAAEVVGNVLVFWCVCSLH